MTETPDILVCALQLPGLTPLVGSIPGRCSKCGRGVWLASSSLLLLNDKPDIEIRCTECLPDVRNMSHEICMTPAQMDEVIENWLGRLDVARG